MMFETESGSLYEIRGKRVRRVPGPDSDELRSDEDWLDLVEKPLVTVGRPVRMVLTGVSSSANFTIRTTTPVKEISE